MSQTQQGLPPRQVYSFEGTPPDISQPSGMGGMWAVLGALVLLIFGIIIFSNTGPSYTPRPMSVSRQPEPYTAAQANPVTQPIPTKPATPTYAIGPTERYADWEEARPIPCPEMFQNKAMRCQAITLPANGSWVRRSTPEEGSHFPLLENVEARDCNGQINRWAKTRIL